MSWSLELRNGDLTISGAQLGQSTGPSKLVQDLRCALLEARGSDDLHPSYGSILDGGRDEFGNDVASIIGTYDWELAAVRVDSEIRRVCAEYQTQQTQRAKNDRYTYGESTLTNDELLLDISSLQMFEAQDKLMVQVTLTTARGEPVQVNIPISSS